MKNQFIVLLLVVCFTSSCTEEVKSPGEEMTELMAKIVKEENIKKAWAYKQMDTGYVLEQQNSRFRLEGNYIVFLPDAGGFITQYYNADKVISFETYDGVLYIYFD